jgi:LPS sulfotransferase NodH
MQTVSQSRKETIWRLRREVKAYWASVFSPAPKTQRVLIFAQGRTGSTLLESLLVSTQHFEERGEMLGANNERVRLPARYLRGMARRHPDQNFLCHVKIYHLTTDRTAHGARPVDVNGFLRALAADGWKIVYLRRRDKFQHYLSGLIAKQRDAYHKYDAGAEDWQIEVDQKDLVRGITTRRRLDQDEAAALLGIAHLPLVYEDDLMTPEAQAEAVGKILDLAGLEQRAASTRMQKINARPLQQTVTNYDDALRWAAELNAFG